ncbi:MAG: hypothetical protein QGG36_06920 [Pirellulaceae bacterium]|nr:hypothetical protein [Pirellulaceae bacterium]
MDRFVRTPAAGSFHLGAASEKIVTDAKVGRSQCPRRLHILWAAEQTVRGDASSRWFKAARRVTMAVC